MAEVTFSCTPTSEDRVDVVDVRRIRDCPVKEAASTIPKLRTVEREDFQVRTVRSEGTEKRVRAGPLVAFINPHYPCRDCLPATESTVAEEGLVKAVAVEVGVVEVEKMEPARVGAVEVEVDAVATPAWAAAEEMEVATPSRSSRGSRTLVSSNASLSRGTVGMEAMEGTEIWEASAEVVERVARLLLVIPALATAGPVVAEVMVEREVAEVEVQAVQVGEFSSFRRPSRRHRHSSIPRSQLVPEVLEVQEELPAIYHLTVRRLPMVLQELSDLDVLVHPYCGVIFPSASRAIA
jgi:hypothetical protein